jgi:choline dehydrogenase
MAFFIIAIMLQIAVNSQATKVLIDPDTKIARGVQYIDQTGNTQTVYALKEVILSAGAINSPQLLLLSGVGPRQDLEAVGINTIVDLPGVGQNLQNHVAASVGFYMNESATDSLTLESLKEFIGNRRGNMASTGLTQTTLLMTSKYAKDGVPDLQVTVCHISANISFIASPNYILDFIFPFYSFLSLFLYSFFVNVDPMLGLSGRWHRN